MARNEFVQMLACASLLVLAGCSHYDARAVGTPVPVDNDNSYTDLHAGATVRIVVPLLKSGAFYPHLGSTTPQAGNTLTFAAPDLIGYMTSSYAVIGKNGKVKLKFVSAQQVRNGNSVPLAKGATVLPFQLPNKTEYVRLIYLVRASQADHNMAIIGCKNRDELNRFTQSLLEHPNICNTITATFCSWVPAGVAVRQED